MWSEKHPEGKLFYPDTQDVHIVRENCKLPGDRRPLVSADIVEAATNGLGTLMRTDINGAEIEFFVTEELWPVAEMTLKFFAGLTDITKD